jgi:hypothetical protein
MSNENKSGSKVDIDFRNNLQIAANGNFAYLAPNLFQLLGYRQKITLEAEFDYVNNKIKKLIGL